MREESGSAIQRRYSLERFIRLATVASALFLVSFGGLYYNGLLPVELAIVLATAMGIMTVASAKLWYDLREVRLNG